MLLAYALATQGRLAQTCYGSRPRIREAASTSISACNTYTSALRLVPRRNTACLLQENKWPILLGAGYKQLRRNSFILTPSQRLSAHQEQGQQCHASARTGNDA